jgi:hypothetical protein
MLHLGDDTPRDRLRVGESSCDVIDRRTWDSLGYEPLDPGVSVLLAEAFF